MLRAVWFFFWRGGKPTLRGVLTGLAVGAALWFTIYAVQGYKLGTPPLNLASPDMCYRTAKIDFVIPMYKADPNAVSNSCGQGTDPPTSGTATTPPGYYTMPAEVGGSGCALQLAGHDATVYFSSTSVDVRPACADLIQTFAQQGLLWNESANFVSVAPSGAAGPTDPADNQLVCHLQDGGADAYVLVWDSGSADYGTQVCTSLLAGTWTQFTQN